MSTAPLGRCIAENPVEGVSIPPCTPSDYAVGESCHVNCVGGEANSVKSVTTKLNIEIIDSILLYVQ